MKIAFVSSEAVPFAKTGGLADVAGALPKYLQQAGCDVKVFIPKYSSIDEQRFGLQYDATIGRIPVRVGGIPRDVYVHHAPLPGSTVDAYFIDNHHFFHRGSIYTNAWDEDERFICFVKGVIELLQRLEWAPDVMHCNDWPTGLLPVLLKDNYSWDGLFQHTATLMSIHNIGYQGLFPRETMQRAEIRPELFHPGGPLEFNNAVSFLKAGIVYSDSISTVSETYAREILTPAYGAGMDGVLRSRTADLFGILNGIDDEDWNPENDRHLPFHYAGNDLRGKTENKKFLLSSVGMEFSEHRPVIGIISRLVAQKGFDLFEASLGDLMDLDAQWVILGTGEERFEEMFRSLAASLSGRVWVHIGFNNELAHLIEAGADMFLMPSHYEPCGLNQMYSLRYGTVPLVRHTGGLADTVHDWHESTWNGRDDGNGFSFHDATGYALFTTVRRAVTLFHDRQVWRKIQRNGMQQDFSWNASAKKYIGVYGTALARRRG